MYQISFREDSEDLSSYKLISTYVSIILKIVNSTFLSSKSNTRFHIIHILVSALFTNICLSLQKDKPLRVRYLQDYIVLSIQQHLWFAENRRGNHSPSKRDRSYLITTFLDLQLPP